MTAGVLALAGTLYVGGFRVGPLPPLGPFLDPVGGVWSVARSATLPNEYSAFIPGLVDEVEVQYDFRGVPHIWASSREDAVRALGFVVARDRLFQLEVQSRAPEGTLTELAGSAALDLDREQRRLGMGWSAQREMRQLDPQSSTSRLLRAFADGVNAWIGAMGPGDLPFEYHLLGRTPRRWEALHNILLNKRMGYTLIYDPQELWRPGVEALVGKAAADALFPVNNPIVQPIQPNDSPQPRFDFAPLPPPAEPTADAEKMARLYAETQDALALTNLPLPLLPLAWGSVRGAAPGSGGDEEACPRVGRGCGGPAPGRGRDVGACPRVGGRCGGPAPGGGSGGGKAASNNWAVSPARTASGHALLSGDPHLSLTLPSIWYEVHMSVPGAMDVHGVTIPGYPGVVIGFTRDIAWSFTNTGADVLDFYRETLDDEAAPTRYRLDGEWRRLERRIEEYRDQGGEILATDTVYYTHRGPVRRSEDGALSMRWTALDQPLNTESFAEAVAATDVEEWLDAIATYPGPAQNMIVADRAGNIAIRSTGLYPIRPGDGSGLVVRDGSESANDWQGYWPVESYPTAINPDQGFLASANQQPLDPALGRPYLGANWWVPWRAMRINQLLASDSQVTVEAMRGFHTDPGNVKADLFVPIFLEAAEGRAPLEEAYRLLAGWDRRYTKDNERAILFELAMSELVLRTFDELFPADSRRLAARPSPAVIAGLLRYPDSPWWDDRRTADRKETRDDVLSASLTAALELAKERYGDPDAGGWRWSGIRQAHVNHLIGLPALSRRRLPVQGGPGNLNPSSGSGNFGASWRMIVEMASDVRAWVTYPGGQSGNPASPWYADRVDQWVRGELDAVLSPREQGDLTSDDVVSVLTLRKVQ